MRAHAEKTTGKKIEMQMWARVFGGLNLMMQEISA